MVVEKIAVDRLSYNSSQSLHIRWGFPISACEYSAGERRCVLDYGVPFHVMRRF